MEDIGALQQRLNAALSVPDNARDENNIRNPQGFSVFDESQLSHALHDTTQFMEIANGNPDRPLAAVMDVVEQKLNDDVNDNEAIRHGLMVFLTHHPIAQASGLKITSLAQRAPSLTVPVQSKVAAPDGEDTEVALNYFREDVNLSEHHEHWHIVYPGGGIPNPANPSQRRAKDRQGELFYWMHQQMIGRYNAERICNGFERVKAIVDLQDVLESDVPDANLRYRGKAFTPRPVGAKMRDLGRKGEKGYYPLSTLQTWDKNLIEACKSGKWRDGKPITADALGSTLESNINGVDKAYYGNMHNMGHVIISYLATPEDWQSPDSVPGMMYETRTAVRDPVFWRWHSHIDDLFNLWQENQPILEFKDVPAVNFDKGAGEDIITVFEDVIAAEGIDVNDAAAVEAWGEKTFGGDAWDSVPNPKFSTDTFETEMRTRTFKNVNDDGSSEEIQYLFPREYAYFFRVSNPTDEEKKISLRINMVPAVESENRRSWFEMDKFHITIPAKTNKVVYRRCDQSSVIRKPAQKTVEQMDDRRDEDDGMDRTGDQYCDCGWPFNLLLPKGSPEGVPFKLSVLATDWNIDNVPTNTGCGSMSFCGAKEKYPDTREMGYPFIRKFAKSIAETINEVPSWTAKDITIKHVTGGFALGKTTATSSSATKNEVKTAAVTETKEIKPVIPKKVEKTVDEPPAKTATSSWSESSETLPNGDVVTTVIENLPNGTKKTSKTTRKKVPKGTPGPWDKAKPGSSTSTSIDELGRKVEITETIDEDGVKKINKRIFAKE